MTAQADATDYSIRWFEVADTDDFLALYDESFGGGSPEWFRWKYRENPLWDEVPILVSTIDGEFAGARAQVPFRMHVGDEQVLAMRFGDTMVHPDHRRRGVFTRLTERALEHFAGSNVEFCYNCPNDRSMPGFLEVGGTRVTDLTSYYRVQRPAALSRTTDGIASVAGKVANPASAAYLTARDYLATIPDGIDVDRHDDVPVDRLARLYDAAPPPSIHAVHDEAFLSWRYGNPMWDYAAFTADVDGEDAAAVVTGCRTDEHDVTTWTIVDVLPLESTAERDRALRALLDVVVDRARDADLVAYCGRAIPPAVLADFGFHDDRSFPLKSMTEPTTLVAYDVSSGDREWTVGGRDLRDPETWRISYVELDAR